MLLLLTPANISNGIMVSPIKVIASSVNKDTKRNMKRFWKTLLLNCIDYQHYIR